MAMIKGGARGLQEAYERTKNTLSRYKEQANAAGTIFIGTAVSGVTGAALGYYDGRYGGKELFDTIPVPAAVALAGIGAEFFEVGGKDTARYLGDAGRAGAAVYGYTVGRSAGLDAKAKKGETSTSGDDSLLDGLI